MEDPYQWLENIEDEKVLEFINTKNYEFKKRFHEMSSRLYPRVMKYYETPVVQQVKCFNNGLYALVRMKDRHHIYRYYGSSKELILDSKNLGEDIVIHWIDSTRDGEVIAYAYSHGTDVARINIVDVENKETLDSLEGSIWDIAWVNRDKYYYVRFYRDSKTPDGVEAPASRIFLKEVGGKEEIVFGLGLRSQYMVSIHESANSNIVYIVISYGWVKNSLYSGYIENPSTWQLLYDPGDTIVNPIDYVNGKHYVVTYDQHGLGRILALTSNGELREVVKEDSRYPLEEAVIYGDKIVANYLVNASSRLRIFDLSGKLLRELSFSKPGTITQLQSCSGKCVFRYISFNTPYRIYVLENDEPRVIDEKTVGNICVDEHFVKSIDETPLHVFHIYNCNEKSGRALLTGYGGFGLSMTPRYLEHLLVFIEDGGEFFLANIRGGGEYGRKWHEAARREKRVLAYSDFAAVLKWLKSMNYKVVIEGRSNGGLLCGVMYAWYPELLDGAVIGYPLLDMLRYHRLYIGKLWVPEYGDPDNPNDREYLLRISPYHNIVRGKNYPPCLIYTGLNDDRVHPGHALKFSAKLNELGVESYLRVETASGHIGANPEIMAKEKADILAFTYTVLGLKEDKL
jgi:prolyl oligopeptidase